MAYIEFREVRKTYRMGETEIHALSGVNFTIEQGEFVILVGASGAGKSTILNILGGMDSLTDGHVYLDADRRNCARGRRGGQQLFQKKAD